MEKQRLFKSRYVRYLKDNVTNRKLLGNYRSSPFIHDEEETLVFPNIVRPDGLWKEMDPQDDLSSAICLYGAFSNINLLQASDERFWTYLAHVDLYQYMKERWNGEIGIGYIFDHFLFRSVTQRTLMLHGLSGLWWGVHLSIVQDRSDKFELTRILFRILDFPHRTLGMYRLGRHKEAVIGILDFIREHENLFDKNFQGKTRYITKFLNQTGGVKPLVYRDREYFKSKLFSIRENIASV